MLSGLALMGQASRSDSQVFDLSPSVDDGPVPAEVDVGGGEVAEAFVVAAVVVAFDEGANAGFEIARQVAVHGTALLCRQFGQKGAGRARREAQPLTSLDKAEIKRRLEILRALRER